MSDAGEADVPEPPALPTASAAPSRSSGRHTSRKASVDEVRETIDREDPTSSPSNSTTVATGR